MVGIVIVGAGSILPVDQRDRSAGQKHAYHAEKQHLQRSRSRTETRDQNYAQHADGKTKPRIKLRMTAKRVAPGRGNTQNQPVNV